MPAVRDRERETERRRARSRAQRPKAPKGSTRLRGAVRRSAARLRGGGEPEATSESHCLKRVDLRVHQGGVRYSVAATPAQWRAPLCSDANPTLHGCSHDPPETLAQENYEKEA